MVDSGVEAVLQDVKRQVCEAQDSWRRQCSVNEEEEERLPFLTLTYAQSIDGSLAAERGQSTLLSGPASMKMTHMLRTLHDGILVGVGTIIADNPSLNTRLVEGRNPRPIIVDTHLRCPPSIKLFTLPACEKPIILFADASSDPEILQRRQVLEALGARIIACQTVHDGAGHFHVDLRDVFRIAQQNGIESIMIEGGASILTSCLQETARRHLIDLVVVTVAPTFIGGLRAVSGLLVPSNTSELEPSSSTSAASTPFPRLEHPRYHVLGQDLVILGHFVVN